MAKSTAKKPPKPAKAGVTKVTTTSVETVSAASANSTATNVIDIPSESLQRFDLNDLQQYTQEKTYSTTASKDFHLFYVGRDDVHGILKHVLSRVSVSLYLNMFGYDDPELNDILIKISQDATITVMVTLDKGQASGPHEKALIEEFESKDMAGFNTHVVIGQSATHQISHTKGFVADGRVAGEGSTNWSVAGEGQFVTAGKAGGTGYKAQNNTQSIITDPDTISRFSAQLIAEHMIARQQPGVVKH
jgi:hypothetical protein